MDGGGGYHFMTAHIDDREGRRLADADSDVAAGRVGEDVNLQLGILCFRDGGAAKTDADGIAPGGEVVSSAGEIAL